ncbi:hypothetical protein [Thermodesulfitimonas autotrophica]|uniref:hypothetical protein n=1 Tax=Thermodesulfitimonas autotrophica TaxID=1894989 RepID=UPI001475CBA9|nr:hypothetical protein [Thermodesulfitimonas autotrophica]
MVYSVVVRDKVRWRLLVRKLSGKEELVIDKGAYLKAATGRISWRRDCLPRRKALFCI